MLQGLVLVFIGVLSMMSMFRHAVQASTLGQRRAPAQGLQTGASTAPHRRASAALLQHDGVQLGDPLGEALD